MSAIGKSDQVQQEGVTTLVTGSVPSCLRNKNDPQKKHPLDRRVSFPEDDQEMITGFLDPANPWEYAENVHKDDLVTKYTTSCEKHGTRPINRVVSQLKLLDYELDRNDCLDLKDEMLGPAACESLEEIFKRIQFVTVNLEGTNLDDESSVALFDMMEYYESAVRLNITGNHCIAMRGWQACSRMIKRTKCLEELDARNTTLNETYMPILSRALRLSTQLHVLKLENCNLSGRPTVILAAALKLNTGLKELYLGENYLMPIDASQLSALLKVNTVLQLLDISNNNIQDEGLAHLAEGLLEQSAGGGGGGGLQVLVLWNNRLSRACAPHLARVFAHAGPLETVNIGQNVLSNEVLYINKLALQQNKMLLRLGMQSTHLTCEGAVALAEIIAANQTIQRIDLRDNNLQVAGLMALVLSMRVSRSVTQLDLDDMPRRKHSMIMDGDCSDVSSDPELVESKGPALDEYLRLVAEIRELCEANAASIPNRENIEEVVKEEILVPNIERRSRLGSFATRKISLTCETLARAQAIPAVETPQLLTEPKRSGGRLRSPAPSPIPSPVASPSPTRSRFQVSRVAESDSPVTPSPPSLTPNVFFGSTSRFKVTVVDAGAPAAPATVTSSNNVTVGFETAALSSSVLSPSPAPSPTPIPAPLLSSIPSLFPTPMPSPMPSPLVSPTPSPTYISPLSTINVGEAHSASPFLGDESEPRKPVKSVQLNDVVTVNISEFDTVDMLKSEKDVTPVAAEPERSKNSSTEFAVCETILEESPSDVVTERELSSRSCSERGTSARFSPRSSASPPKVCKMRSESEDGDRELYLNRKLPKAMDSLDLSALRVVKQASVCVPDKPTAQTQRVRKISSWVQPSAMFSAITQDDTGKTSSSLERLLGLFTNPFTRTKTEEEPLQQLERVPELAETSVQKCDPAADKSSTNKENSNLSENIPIYPIAEEILLDGKDKVNDDSENSHSSSINEPAHNGAENVVESGVESDSFSCPKSCLTSNGCEPKCDSQVVNNIPLILNNCQGVSGTEVGGVKCETWPQSGSMGQMNFIHQAQSHSSPCLTALVFLKSNISTTIAAEMESLSGSGGEDSVDSAKNISLAH